MMGLCLCKGSDTSSNKYCCGCNSTSCPCCFQWGKSRSGDISGGGTRGPHNLGTSAGHRDTLGSDRTTSSSSSDPSFLLANLSPQLIDNYVLETLRILRTLVGK